MHIKILCLNVFEGGIFWDNIVSFIKRENPDVLCLQEVVKHEQLPSEKLFQAGKTDYINYQSFHQFRELLPDFHYFFEPELREVRKNGAVDGGNAIFSRFPLSEKKTIFLHGKYETVVRPADEKDFSHYPKNMVSAVANIEGKELHIYNMHGIWGLDGGDSPERLRMSELIVDEIQGKHPAVLMGDFNIKPDTQTIQNIEKHMTNVFKDELTSSFNMRHKTNPGYATAVVDMFFTSPDVKIFSKSTPDDDVSDHIPLIVTIEL